MTHQFSINKPENVDHRSGRMLRRRSLDLGWLQANGKHRSTDELDLLESWQSSAAIYLQQAVSAFIKPQEKNIARSLLLMEQVLADIDCEDIFSESLYQKRLKEKFEMLGSIYDEGDSQEIEKIEFDAVENGEIIAENLWVKLSWLSFDEDDPSFRLRFSFGLEKYEDVAQDLQREILTARLSEAIFPESVVISKNEKLIAQCKKLMQEKSIEFVERIIYFNAPNGGAQFHHDVEKGHAGVVFAQLHGRTAWFALSKQQLLDEVSDFMHNGLAKEIFSAIGKEQEYCQLKESTRDIKIFSEQMNEGGHEHVEVLLNQIPMFLKQLADKNFIFILEPGDVILLPQKDEENCAWHSVFCFDDFPGHALSFAIRSGRDE